jgi:TIR domain
MPPEEIYSLVAVKLDIEDGMLKCHGERATPAGDFLRVSWYTTPKSIPQDYQAMLGGVVFAYKPSLGAFSQFPDLTPTKRGDRYVWRDVAGSGGLMYIMVLPRGYTIANPEPIPVEAKKFEERVALFWLVYSTKGESSSSIAVEWSLSPLREDLDLEIENINRQIFFASKRERTNAHDIALSYAGEDRDYVDQVAAELARKGVNVFYDKFEEDKLWGKNLYDYLSEIYQNARFTVMFISRWYGEKFWTNFERKAAQARAFSESREYILPARFDDTELPGMLPTTAYISLSERSPADLATLIIRKLESTIR